MNSRSPGRSRLGASELSANGVHLGNLELIETSVFTRQITELLSDDEYRRFQTELAANPALGPVIRGGGGIRKVRVAAGSRGKSGGARVIYYWAKQTAQLATAVKEEFGDEEQRT